MCENKWNLTLYCFRRVRRTRRAVRERPALVAAALSPTTKAFGLVLKKTRKEGSLWNVPLISLKKKIQDLLYCEVKEKYPNMTNHLLHMYFLSCVAWKQNSTHTSPMSRLCRANLCFTLFSWHWLVIPEHMGHPTPKPPWFQLCNESSPCLADDTVARGGGGWTWTWSTRMEAASATHPKTCLALFPTNGTIHGIRTLG